MSISVFDGFSLFQDLYEDCLKMRTQLFRMASQSAEDKDETLCMYDILRIIVCQSQQVLILIEVILLSSSWQVDKDSRSLDEDLAKS